MTSVNAKQEALLDELLKDYKQSPQSTRRNVLPVKLIDGSLLMRHEHLACALV